MRVILYTGKGGVGKTSVAAATACRIAKEGKRVIILSTDQAHSLRDSFERKLAPDPIKVMDNLDAAEIDVIMESERVWGNIKGYLERLLTAQSDAGLEAEELLIFPGLEELFALLKLLDIYESKKYDIMIVDCAPTGETLSLLKFPELFGSIINRLLPIKKKAINIAGAAIEKVTKIPMPDDPVFKDVEDLLKRLERLQKLMLDKNKVSIRIVTTPEKIIINETKRNFTCLHLLDYNVDAVIVNKVYPPKALEGYFRRWALLQEDGIKELKESFHDIPLFYLKLRKDEIKGIPILLESAKLYGNMDPSLIFHLDKIFDLVKEGNKMLFKINLPFVKKDEMELTQRNQEIEIALRNERRYFSLPKEVQRMEIQSAKLDAGVLTIVFAS